MTYDNEWVYSGLGIPESDNDENLDLTTKNEESEVKTSKTEEKVKSIFKK